MNDILSAPLRVKIRLLLTVYRAKFDIRFTFVANAVLSIVAAMLGLAFMAFLMTNLYYGGV